MHALIEHVCLVLQQIPYDVLAVPAHLAFLDEAGLLASRTKAQVLLLLSFLLGQEEALVGDLSDRVNETDAVVNVVAVKQPNELVGHLDRLVA